MNEYSQFLFLFCYKRDIWPKKKKKVRIPEKESSSPLLSRASIMIMNAWLFVWRIEKRPVTVGHMVGALPWWLHKVYALDQWTFAISFNNCSLSFLSTFIKQGTFVQESRQTNRGRSCPSTHKNAQTFQVGQGQSLPWKTVAWFTSCLHGHGDKPKISGWKDAKAKTTVTCSHDECESFPTMVGQARIYVYLAKKRRGRRRDATSTGKSTMMQDIT